LHIEQQKLDLNLRKYKDIVAALKKAVQEAGRDGVATKEAMELASRELNLL
jgi:urease gamma subunit